ncbi:MAG: hypothetical protein COB13_008190, partial [OCS116 cluster bacterium]|nr:hypothetical protein [OCS116 cluster bacterium]
MGLSQENLKCLASVVLKAGACIIDPTGSFAAIAAYEFFAQRSKDLSHLGEKQTKYCQAVEKQVIKSIKKNYKTWLKGPTSEGRTNDSVEAALKNLPAALKQANITVHDMTLSEQAFTTKILDELSDFPEYKKNETARNIFISLIILMRNVANLDQNLKPFFDHQRYENIIGKFDKVIKNQENAQTDSDKKHQELLEAIAKEKGVPIENLEPLFEAVEQKAPNV